MALLFMFRIVFYLVLLATVLGHPGYQDMIPNGRNVPSWAGVGHLMPEGGGPRNQFGLDFLAAGLNWTKALCELDSDGDGMTNGQELGDPQCVWQQGQTPARTTGITHPGLPDNPNSPGFCTPVNSYADSFTVDLKVSNLIIPNNTANYACQTFNLTTDLWPSGVTETNSYIVKFEPILDNVAMVQHILLQECITYAAVNGACPQSGATLCDRIAYAWGPTDKEFCLPHFIGMPVNPSKFYMLKIFYNNPSQTNGLVDNSGIRVTVTANQTIQIPAGVLMTGRIESRRLILPAGQANITTSGVCPASCTQLIIPDANGINVFGSFLFMHSLGRRIWTQRSDNTTSVAEFLGDDLDFVTTNYTFTPNAPFDKIRPNDKIFTACEYDTTSVTSTVVEGEVCFSFLMHYPRLGVADNACGSFTADTYRDNRETAFCGSASLWDVANNNPLPLAKCYPITQVAAPMAYALDVILPECRVNGVDQCNDNCTAMLSEWIAGPCIEDWGISFMFDFTCSNSTCDEFQALLTHNCYGICAYNLESMHCPVPSGNITSYKCVNHQCVAVYVTPPTPTDPVAAPTDPTPTTTPTDLAPSNSVRFNQRYGPAYYAMMSVVVAVGVAIAGFAVGFFVWKTVQNRELNYNANINPN